jgi:hypothetical protein
MNPTMSVIKVLGGKKDGDGDNSMGTENIRNKYNQRRDNDNFQKSRTEWVMVLFILKVR